MSLRVDLTKLRNLIVSGQVGTVTWVNSLNPTVAVSDIVNQMTGVGNSALSVMLPMKYSFAPDAASQTSILPATNLSAAHQHVSAAAQPDYPRFLQIKGGVAGQAGDVVITGTDALGATITDTIAENGVAAVSGVRAFKTVTDISLPAQSHSPVAQVETATANGTITVGVKQVETATAAGTITLAGDASVIITAAGMTGSPKTKAIAVALNDTASQWADKVRVALAADADVTALFDVSGTTTAIVLTSKTKSANDATLNISLDNGTCTGITTAAASANTTAGVATGTGNASVIVTAAGMTGSPKTILVPVTDGDIASAWALKVRSALSADSAVSAMFTVGGSGATIVLTAKAPAANDATLNIDLDNGTSTGIVAAHASANTTAGVAYDTVSVGFVDTFGIPHVLYDELMMLVNNFNGADDAGTLTIHAEVSKNVFALAGVADGTKIVDLIYLK